MEKNKNNECRSIESKYTKTLVFLTVRNRHTLGGLKGYVSGTFISRTKLPPSYGVSGGPAISPLSSV